MIKNTAELTQATLQIAKDEALRQKMGDASIRY